MTAWRRLLTGRSTYAVAGAVGTFGGLLATTSGTIALADQGVAPPGQKKKERLVILGTGWGAASVLQEVDFDKYDVWCVSPRNHFLFTPLLPSAAVGTLDARSVVDSVRRLFGEGLTFVEAYCVDIDPVNKIVTTQSEKPFGTNDGGRGLRDVWDPKKLIKGREEMGEGVFKFADKEQSSSRIIQDSTRSRPQQMIAYDKLIVAVGADNNTFGTPGVEKHAHFLKELPDARRIRTAVSDAFESAALPGQPEKERKRLLHFVVVGGGPTGVEYAAELADFVKSDGARLFPKLCAEDVKISLVEVSDHILTMFDARVSEWTEKEFARNNINTLTGKQVMEVKSDRVVLKDRRTKEVTEEPCALVVWATGIKPRDLVERLRKSLGEGNQNNRRALITDGRLEVVGAPGVYAIGDCATIQQRRMLERMSELFTEADADGNGRLSLEEFKDMIAKNAVAYPQLEFYGRRVENSFQEADQDKSGGISNEEFRAFIEKADKGLRMLPATAQVASQEGTYLAGLLNKLADDPNGPTTPFRYTHMGSLVYVGDEQAAVDFTGVDQSYLSWLVNMLSLGPLQGSGVGWLWRSYYWSSQFSARNRALLSFDWARTQLFGRDVSRS